MHQTIKNWFENGIYHLYLNLLICIITFKFLKLNITQTIQARFLFLNPRLVYDFKEDGVRRDC